MLRAALGLVSLLICTLVVVYLFTKDAETATKTSEVAGKEANQIAGRDENGTPVADQIATQPEERDGRLKDLLVTNITPGSPWDTRYGLVKGDKITALNGLKIDIFDSGVAIAQLTDTYRGSQPIEVIRDGKTITLPLPAGSPQAASGATATPGTASPNSASPTTAPAPTVAPTRNNPRSAAEEINKLIQGAGQ